VNQRVSAVLVLGLLLTSANSFARCYGYAGPGGPCYAGPGGGAYDGPGGPAYSGPGGGGGVSPNCR
jgi:hypothetical protein